MHILIQATFYRKFARARVQEKQRVEMPLSHLHVLHRTPKNNTQDDRSFPLWSKLRALKGNLKSNSVSSTLS